MPDGKRTIIKILQEVAPLVIDAAKIENDARLAERAAKTAEQTLEKRKALLAKMWSQPQPETCRGCGKPSPMRQPVFQPTPPGVTGVKDPHYDYTVKQLVKNLALLQDHYTDYRCPECIKKHLALIEGYAEEGISMTQDPKEVGVFRCVAKWAQGVEGRTDYDELIQGARLARLSLTGREHGDTEK